MSLQKHLNQNLNISMELIQGFFDADGSFQIRQRIDNSYKKPVTFYLTLIFQQQVANRSFLEQARTFFCGTTPISNSRNDVIPTITSRSIKNKSGTTSESVNFGLNFNNPGGQKLLKAWETDPPKSPTKLLDYRISLLLFEVNKTDALTLLKKKGIKCEDPNVANLALLWVRYQTYASSNQQQKNLTPLENHYDNLCATQDQIEQSIKIGRKLMKPILDEKERILKNSSLLIPRITEDYLLGYHIGDGSFFMITNFNNATQEKFTIRFYWTITDCAENYPILEAIKEKLKREGIAVNEISKSQKENCYTLSVTNLDGCVAIVRRWENKYLPEFRLKQYKCFTEALEIYYISKSHLTDLKKAERIIDLKWEMNAATNEKKSGSKQEDLNSVRAWFNLHRVQAFSSTK